MKIFPVGITPYLACDKIKLLRGGFEFKHKNSKPEVDQTLCPAKWGKSKGQAVAYCTVPHFHILEIWVARWFFLCVGQEVQREVVHRHFLSTHKNTMFWSYMP